MATAFGTYHYGQNDYKDSFSKRNVLGRINFVIISKADLIKSYKWRGVELLLYFVAVSWDVAYKINLWPELISQ